MGYTTYFDGQFNLDHPLTIEHRNYLKAFSEVRHVLWNVELLEQIEDDPIRKAVGLPIGKNGQYFTGSVAIRGKCVGHPALAYTTLQEVYPELFAEIASFSDEPPTLLSGYNFPPSGVPNLWCHWEPNVEGTAIQWDGGEKFGGYVSWLRYLLEHFLIPWHYKLNGRVHWRGEYDEDEGSIVVINNEITLERVKESQPW